MFRASLPLLYGCLYNPSTSLGCCPLSYIGCWSLQYRIVLRKQLQNFTLGTSDYTGKVGQLVLYQIVFLLVHLENLDLRNG